MEKFVEIQFMNELVTALKKSRINARTPGSLGLLSIFDDIEFSNIDYDVITGQDRAKIYDVMVHRGWSARGSRVFQKDGLKIRLPKPSHTLGCNPADVVLESIDQYDIHFVTPTQALLVLLAQRAWDQHVAEEFVFYHPANIDKFKQWALHDKLPLAQEISYEGQKVFQAEGVKKIRRKTFRTIQELRESS